MGSAFSLSNANTTCKALDLETLKEIYTLVKENNFSDYQSNDMISSIVATALEIYNDKYSDDSSDDDGDEVDEVIKRKSYALKCLLLASVHLDEYFCSNFFDSLINIFETYDSKIVTSSCFTKLYDYMYSSPLKDKLLLLETLTTCLASGKLNFAIFEQFPTDDWRTELLSFVLFDKLDAEVDTVQRVINKINNINGLENINCQFTIENILDALVCNSEEHDYDIYFVNDLFHVMTLNPSIISLLFLNFTDVLTEINEIKMFILKTHYSQFSGYSLDVLNFFLKYPLDTLAILIQKEIVDFQQLVQFKNMLEYLKTDITSQIKILMQCNPKESFNELIYKTGFEIVRSIISDIFLAYNKYSRRIGHKNSGLLPLVTASPIQCTCSTSKCVFHNTTECCDLLYSLNHTLTKVMFSCCEMSEKVIEVIEMFLIGINKAQKIHDLINALETLYDYDIKFTDIELYQFFYELTAENYEQEIHKLVIERSFHGSYEKSIDQLLDEIENTHPEETSAVIDFFDETKYSYKQKSVLFPNGNKICSWGREEVQFWATRIRCGNNNNPVPDAEILAVINRAIAISLKVEIRNVQLLTVIIMIKCNKGMGRLAQVNTGEGKTVIIAALAAYYVLKSHKVDVFTSSPVLAIPQAENLKPFYGSLKITVTHNILPDSNYGNDIIYGTNNSFQRDVLQDDFRQSGIRKCRVFDIAIVDEVDNMLIDGNNWILMLTCEMPAMDYLEVVLAAIYLQVNEAARCLVERDGQTYYLIEEDSIDDQGNVKSEINVQEVPIKESKRDFIINQTETHLRKLIRDKENCEVIEENYPEIKIPNHLREVICKTQLKKWISNAISAMFWYANGEDYVIKNGKVTIVDADNTGTLKSDSHYCAGLHQFLEFKHGARVQPENFTTNFISNVGLFTRYTSKLYGLTGTLGSTETKLFLHDTYNVDSVVIPPFKRKQHKHLNPVLVTKDEERYIEIAKSCIRKLRNGQAALIIMKYIRETEELEEVFKNTFNYDASKIKIVKTDDDSVILENVLRSGEAIITTNVAGRGTDLKLHEDVENHGGLHVCLTFLPLNSRVEQQNIGRTSRKGNRGTSQFVIHDPKQLANITELKQIRDKQQAKNMVQASITVKRVKAKDRLFRKFCSLLRKINGRNSETKKTELKAVEERFAIWLLLNEDKINSDNDDIDRSFEEFQNGILEDDHNNQLIKNPCMYIELGNYYLQIKKYEKAISEYTNAIILDRNFSEHAHYNRAWAYLAKYGSNIKNNCHFINEAITDLRKARKLIEDKEYSLHLLQTASKGEVFSEQVSHKLNLYSIQKNTIDLAIGPDEEAINGQIKKLDEDRQNQNISETDKSNIDTMIEKLKKDKKEMGVIGRAKINNRNIKIESVGDDFLPREERDKHKNEITEFRRNGWIGDFKISEIKPINWGSVISLLGIGLGQLIIGGILTVFTLGAGASIGMGLISEGVSDIITAVKDGIINRDFNWATWALMKVISIAVSIVCAGFKAIKDAAKTAYAGAKNVITTGAKTFTQTTKAGWKIVAKRIGLDLGKGVAKEIVTELVTYGIDRTVIPMIEEKIMESVRDPIQNALLNNTKVKKMLKLDEKKGNQNYENQIRTIAQTLLSPKQNSKLKSIAIQIATRVADHKGLALARQALNGIIGVSELLSFTDSFINQLNIALDDIEVDISNDDNVEENYQHSNSYENGNEFMNECNRDYDDEIDLSKVNQTEEQVKLEQKGRKVEYLSLDLAGMAATNMIQILKGKIIAPITQLGVNYTVDKLSAKVTDNLNKEQENYRSLKNVIHCQNKTYDKSKKSSKSYTKQELDKANKVVNGVKEGGPAGLLHLGAISAATDSPIEVYDSKGRLKYTIGDTKKSKPICVKFHEPENGAKTGHFTLKDGTDPVKNSEIDNNMCLFNVITEQTGHNPNDLKKTTISIMEHNIEFTAQQVKHINRLEMYDKASLLEGGAQYYGNNPDHAKNYLNNSNGIIGHGNVVPGHSDRHVPFKRKTIDKLHATSQETGRQIEVYDSHGNLDHVIGQNNGKDPIKLQYHKPKGDTSAECFTSLGGNEKYNLSDPNDNTYYDIISQQTGSNTNADILKERVLSRMDNITIPVTITCIENYSKTRTKHGFASADQQAFVLHQVMQTEEAKDALEKLNMYAPQQLDKNGDPMDAGEYIRQEVKLSAKDLNLPREVFAGEWKKGRLKSSFPVQDVILVLQHYPGHAGNKNARVHIQTIYPVPPKKSKQNKT